MNVIRGVFAGFVATAVISILFFVKGMMEFMPGLDVIGMLDRVTRGLINQYAGSGLVGGGIPVGWITHFVIGSILWGGLFALFHYRMPGSRFLTKGIFFGIGAWLLMMFVFMPFAGAGYFGVTFGEMAPVATFVVHVIFGAVLGIAYVRLRR